VNQSKLLSYVYPDIHGKDMKPSDMAASISSALRKSERKVLPAELRQEIVNSEGLGQITDWEGNQTKKLSQKERSSGKQSKGSAVQRACYVCRKCQEKYNMATGLCKHCGTCLCLRKKHPGRPMTCQQVHMVSDDPAIRCNGVKKGSFPKGSRSPNFVHKDH